MVRRALIRLLLGGALESGISRHVLARLVLARLVLARLVLARLVLARLVLARLVLARLVLASLVLAQSSHGTEKVEPDADARDLGSATSEESQESPDSSLLAGREDPRSPSPDQIAQWLRQLDDDHYIVREEAQNRLAAAKASALSGVAEAARSAASLESSTRALNILLGWSEGANARLRLSALEHIARLANRPLEASVAAERVADIRERDAIAVLEAKGAQVVVDTQVRIAFGDGSQPTLQVILGPNWQGGIEEIRRIKEIRRATTLSLWSVAISDDAAAEFVKMAHFKRVELYGAEISDQAEALLKQAFVNGAILEIRGPARLGIRGNAPIVEVVAESAAAKAGLQPNDAITHFGGVKVEDFEHLTGMIAKHKPGDEVEVVVQRNHPAQRTFTTTVRFDRWGEGELPKSPEVPLLRRIGNGPFRIVRPQNAAPGAPIRPNPPPIQPIPMPKAPGQ